MKIKPKKKKPKKSVPPQACAGQGSAFGYGGNVMQASAARPRAREDIESSSGIKPTPINEGSIIQTHFIRAGYIPSEEDKEFLSRYGKLRLGNKNCFMIFDFVDSFDLGMLIGKKYTKAEAIKNQALQKVKNTKAELFIRFPQSRGMKWCVIEGNPENVVRFCHDLVMEKVKRLDEKKIKD